MKFGLIGEKLSHSFSPKIHKTLGGYDYELLELAPNELEQFMLKKDFSGINVTIPYKRDVIKYLDFVSEEAEAIGAVNTIVNRGGKLYGYNTDCLGLKSAFRFYGISLEGKKVAVLGTGGTSATAKYVAQTGGAKRVLLVSRSKDKGDITYDELYKCFSDTEVIINTTPSGMYPNVEGVPIDISRFKDLKAVADAVYNPLKTNLVANAKKIGIPAFSGLYMLVAQAAFAAEKFADTDFSSKINSVFYGILNEKRNIALIGMPGSGKSTIGKELAKVLDKDFVDTDDMIVKTAKADIPEIFSEFGEEYFRTLETIEVKKASLYNNTVIATGGGAVLNGENITALSRNCVIVFLDRPLEDIVGTADRPLAKTNEMLRKRYEERIDIYRSSADIIVKIGSCVAENTAKIIDKFKNFGD